MKFVSEILKFINQEWGITTTDDFIHLQICYSIAGYLIQFKKIFLKFEAYALQHLHSSIRYGDDNKTKTIFVESTLAKS